MKRNETNVAKVILDGGGLVEFAARSLYWSLTWGAHPIPGKTVTEHNKIAFSLACADDFPPYGETEEETRQLLVDWAAEREGLSPQEAAWVCCTAAIVCAVVEVGRLKGWSDSKIASEAMNTAELAVAMVLETDIGDRLRRAMIGLEP